MRGGSHTHTHICMLEYKIIGKISPRENTADRALLWPVMEKLNISHSEDTGKLHLSSCWIHQWKFGICAQSLHCKGSLWHLLPVPVKMDHFPSWAKLWFAVGINLCQERAKKGETDIRKMRCNSSCLRKGSSARSRAVWKVWQPKPALRHILCIAPHSLLWNRLELSCAQVFPLRDSTEGTKPFEVLGSLWNDQCLVCPPCLRGELSDIQLAATHVPVSTQSSFASCRHKIHLRMNPLRQEESAEAVCLQLPQSCFLRSYQRVWVSLPKDLSSADKPGQILPNLSQSAKMNSKRKH